MIVYNDLTGKFVRDVREGLIADMILDRIHAQGLGGGEDREFEAWKKSLTYMCDVIDTGEIRDDVSIAIEYNIPLTSKRVDFIISGADGTGRDHIVIVELKQWTSATIPPSGATYCVRTWVANDYRIVCHPSYQAYSYSRLISNFSPSISSGDVDIHPSAYLHNFEKRNKPVLEDGIYKAWFETRDAALLQGRSAFHDRPRKAQTVQISPGLAQRDGFGQSRLRPDRRASRVFRHLHPCHEGMPVGR